MNETTEEIQVDRLKISRFATLDELVLTFTNARASTNNTLLDVVLTCLPSFSTEIELFHLLKDRYANVIASPTSRTPGNIIQVRIKVMLVLRSWMRKLVKTPIPLDDAYDSKATLAKEIED